MENVKTNVKTEARATARTRGRILIRTSRWLNDADDVCGAFCCGLRSARRLPLILRSVNIESLDVGVFFTRRNDARRNHDLLDCRDRYGRGFEVAESIAARD